MKTLLPALLTAIISCIITPVSATPKMPLRTIKKLNLDVPFIGLGTVELGRDWGIAGKDSLHPNEEISQQVLETALQHGWTLIDSASSYQLSEERIGRYLPKNKYDYLLVTKPGEHSITASDPRCKKPAYDNIYCASPGAAYDFSRAAILKDVENSLKLLKVNTIDIVLLHLNNEDAEDVLAKGEAVKALQDLRAENKIRFIGVSVNGPAAITAAKMKELDFLETEYSLINQTNADAIAIAHDTGKGVIVRGGLGTGLLTAHVAKHIDEDDLPYGDKVRALLKLTNHNYDQLTALALAFLYENKNINTVIVGADRPEFIAKDIKLLTEFKNARLLKQAKDVVKTFPTPDFYTENMGEYYFNK